ncbi:MAG: YggS family pyridoxal phosphate-dependent enzyme [Deltaproteobacteria bacterium]|nr:YggS family pyridoxal phosphate-dependent enzyme [Deltaproteobacteria bacterium]
MIAENLDSIRSRIREAATRAGRDPAAIRLVAAAKGQDSSKIQEALAAGVKIFGHNYVQEAERQKPLITSPEAQIHMIGRLQKNKAGKAAELFHVIETVDNEELAQTLDRRAALAGRVLEVMIQVNLAKEPQKSGCDEERVADLAGLIRRLANLKLRGLMTMPPFFDQPERARPYFARLRGLRDLLLASGAFSPEMNELSMGMTGDFEVAIEEGATLVRIGTALFGPRA